MLTNLVIAVSVGLQCRIDLELIFLQTCRNTVTRCCSEISGLKQPLNICHTCQRILCQILQLYVRQYNSRTIILRPILQAFSSKYCGLATMIVKAHGQDD